MFLTHEIGSLAKPSWRVRPSGERKISEKSISEAEFWARKLGIEGYETLIEQLKSLGGPESRETWARIQENITNWASIYALKFLEASGLDVVYDGEQHRSEMYHYPISRSKGFEFRGYVRSFDNKYYLKASCVGQPGIEEPFHVDEFNFVKNHASKRLKVPITGAYTLADWSFDEYYAKDAKEIGSRRAREKRIEARRIFVLEIARNIVRPNILALVQAGATWIQIDEPAVTTHPDEVPLFVEAFNETVKGIECEFNIHICFSNYDLLFPHIEALEGCSQLCIGFANYDTKELGVKREVRPGYETLYKFRALGKKFRVGVGVLDIHSDYIEPPELVRDRILYAVQVLGNPELVDVCPDCGLRTRTWEVAFEKLRNMVEGKQMAQKAIES